MRPYPPGRWPGNRAIVDQRSGLTTILMMLVSVQAVAVSATLASRHGGWALGLFLVFLLPALWLGRKAYGLGVGLRPEALDGDARLPPALREAARRQIAQLRSQTDRDWLTRAELERLRQSLR